MRSVVVSAPVKDKLSDLKNYLRNELLLSQEAALAYNDRLLEFMV